MLSTESRRGRRILARIDRGADLFDGLRALCQKHHIRCAEVRGSGSLELAELTAFDQDARSWKPSRLVSGGSLELLQLQGTISEEGGAVSIQVNATLMREADDGMEVLGGQLRGAVAYSLELVVETFDDVLLRRQLDPSVGLSRWNEALAEDGAPATPAAATPVAPPRATPVLPPRATTVTPAAPAPRPAPPAAPPPAASQPSGALPRPSSPTLPPPNPNPIQTTTARPVVPSSIPSAAPRRDQPPSSDRPAESATPTPSWADVAAASQAPARPANAEALEEDVQINAGDVILHPRFQRCVVHRVEHSGDYVQVMLRNGRVVRLSLEVLRLTPKGIENGQRIFSATVL